MTIQQVNKVAGILLIFLLISVAIPLTIVTIQTNGGSWGFGMMGMPILLPLCTYLITAVVPFVNPPARQRIVFVTSQVITLITGIVSFFIFPVFPVAILIVPVLLGIIDIVDKPRQQYYLLLMIVLPMIANILLLKWEFDFGRTFPILQLF